MPDDGSTNPDADYQGYIAVTVRVSNPANRSRAELAARKLIAGLKQIQDFFDANYNNVIVVKGNLISIADLYTDMLNTTYIVTDETNFQNGNGVGSASRGQNAMLTSTNSTSKTY